MKSFKGTLTTAPTEQRDHQWMSHTFFSVIFAISLHSAVSFDGPEPALAFYGVYHRNKWNQAIHFVGVPMILWSLMVLAAFVPLSTNKRHRISGLGIVAPHAPTWATVIVLLYVIFYLRIDVPGALLYLPVLLFMYKTSVEWTSKHNQSIARSRVVQWALFLHIMGWYLQIHPGHKILEGAQPAGVANLGAALTTAPLFAFYEAVWYLGFRKELQHRVLQLVDVYTKELCDAGSAMRVCETLR